MTPDSVCVRARSMSNQSCHERTAQFLLYVCCGCGFDFGYDGSEDENSLSSMDEQDTSTFRRTETFTPSSPGSLYSSITTTEPDPELEDDDIKLGSEYDPDEEYVKNYERLGWHNATSTPQGKGGFSPCKLEEIATTVDETLRSNVCDGDTTPRSLINTSLLKYNTCISLTKDLERKKDYIKRYETHKFDFDEDNEEDREKAVHYLSNARKNTVKPSVRLEHYQIAIKFTNNVLEKQKLKEEYRRYAFSVSGRQTNI